MRDSLFSRSTPIVISQVRRKLPSIPLTYKERQIHYQDGGRPEIHNSDLHSVREHPREPERYFLGEFLAMHSNLETIAEIDMNNLASATLQQQIRRVPISQAENVTNHTINRERPSVCCASF